MFSYRKFACLAGLVLLMNANLALATESVVLGMGCFWGVERVFWKRTGVWTTSAGYAGGITPNPTSEEAC